MSKNIQCMELNLDIEAGQITNWHAIQFDQQHSECVMKITPQHFNAYDCFKTALVSCYMQTVKK